MKWIFLCILQIRHTKCIPSQLFAALMKSLYNKSQSLIQTMNENFDLISNANILGEGLHFLIPTVWWQNLLNNNQRIKSFRQMRLPSPNPIEFFYQLSIIDPTSRPAPNEFDDLFRQAESDYKTIKKQLGEAEYSSENENQFKRTKIPCQWLREQNRQFRQDCDLLLFCPKMKQELVDIYELDLNSWTLVAAHVYKEIYDRIFQDCKQSVPRCMLAVPIIVNEVNISRKIEFSQRGNCQIFMKHYSGYSFAFKGYIDECFTLSYVIQVFFDWMVQSIREEANLSYDTINMVVKFGDTIAYKFYSDQRNDRLKWVDFSEFQTIPFGYLKSLKKTKRIVIFAFGGEPDNKMTEGVNGMLSQIEESSIRQLEKTHKKVKRDSSAYSEPKLKRAEVRDIFVGDSGAFRPVVAVETIDVHSSTQEQTPFEEAGQRNVIIIQNHLVCQQMNRIAYPLWKQQFSVEKLLKYGQVRFTIPKILKPYSDPAMIVLKDQGRKVVLPRECNSLCLNEFGELMQKQVSQPVVELGEKPPSEAVAEQLEMLALQIMGIKIRDVIQEAEKIEEGDIAKDSSEYEGVTCKNEFMDQFDCEESRQF